MDENLMIIVTGVSATGKPLIVEGNLENKYAAKVFSDIKDV